jgi:signal transduction histidine kinase
LRNDHRLRFNNLQAGKYDIFVQGADSSGDWSKESLEIKLDVKEVFFRRLWFQILSGLVFATIIYGLLQYHLQEKLRMERLRTQLASDLHDEVSGLLAGISLQSELLRSQTTEKHLSLKLQNIRQASQSAMSKISDVIWSIDSRRDRIEDLITRMEEHADEVLLPLNIRYSININDEINPMTAIPADIRQDIYFIYKEAINNVAKHANANFVDINMKNIGTKFEMVIKDNGFPKVETGDTSLKRKRKGQGISNLKMRAQRLNAQLNIIINPSYTIHLRMKRFS